MSTFVLVGVMLFCFLSGASVIAGIVSHVKSISNPRLHYLNAAASMALAVFLAKLL